MKILIHTHTKHIWTRLIIMRSFPCMGLCILHIYIVSVWRCWKKTDIYLSVHAAVQGISIYVSLIFSHIFNCILCTLSISIWRAMFISLSVCLTLFLLFSVILFTHAHAHIYKYLKPRHCIRIRTKNTKTEYQFELIKEKVNKCAMIRAIYTDWMLNFRHNVFQLFKYIKHTVYR